MNELALFAGAGGATLTIGREEHFESPVVIVKA